ncbi:MULTISPECIES: hypothetical protein [Amycolatopsis]|uniref:hypothetical protein n=1 Tax=Amycolatopsis TaxID=1813 RepID=UPI001178712A|nr:MULTISPECIES: hypothetical protein [Amycolatopsis]
MTPPEYPMADTRAAGSTAEDATVVSGRSGTLARYSAAPAGKSTSDTAGMSTAPAPRAGGTAPVPPRSAVAPAPAASVADRRLAVPTAVSGIAAAGRNIDCSAVSPVSEGGAGKAGVRVAAPTVSSYWVMIRAACCRSACSSSCACRA